MFRARRRVLLGIVLSLLLAQTAGELLNDTGHLDGHSRLLAPGRPGSN